MSLEKIKLRNRSIRSTVSSNRSIYIEQGLQLIDIDRFGSTFDRSTTNIDRSLVVLARYPDPSSSYSLAEQPDSNCPLQGDQGAELVGTIHNPSFGITPLSASKIKKASPKLINFTYTNIGQNK
ncbi:Oxidoreductase andH [Fusarium oxysporum f. sp. albedinis]|nr:Oxidoreductase andH [Fusarium oxysporum f. sp. albedinis]